MQTTRLFLARHGEVINHHEFRFNGHYDVDITVRGVKQMEKLAEFLLDKNISAIYSSDLRRAHRGAEIIACQLSLEYEKLPSLRELNLGRWEGLTMEEVKSLYPDEARFRYQDLAHYRVQGGENLLDLSSRVIPAIDGILNRHKGQNLLIIAHGGVNRALLCRFLQLPIEHFFKIEQDYGCLNVIDFFENLSVVKLVNGGPNQGLNPTII